jgi:putative NIF3 family GTP cyclohydrolase 1 type 2
MATIPVIEEAARRGVDLIVTHEPTLYDHYADPEERDGMRRALGRKAELLRRTGIAVYRVHDGWDPFPVYGNHDAWVAKLGLFEPVEGAGGRLYRTAPGSFRDLVLKVKERMGLPVVRVSGDAGKRVERVVLSQGASLLGPVLRAIERGADALFLGENVEWQAVRLAEDSGLPVALTGHSASEGEGMRRMVEFLSERMPGCEYCYIETGDSFVYM